MIDIAVVGRLVAAGCAVAVVLAAFRSLALALQRGGFGMHGGGARRLRVLETAHLPGGASLHVVRVGAREVVIGRAGGAIAVVCDIEDPSSTGAGPRRRRAG